MSKSEDEFFAGFKEQVIRPKPVNTLKPGDRVFVCGQGHPWQGQAGELVAYEKYGPAEFGWAGWRVKLDGNCGSCYANTNELQVCRRSNTND